MIGIRRARDADRVAIARLHEASIRALGPGAYTAEEVDSWAAGVHPQNYPLEQEVYVAVDDGEVVAFGQARRNHRDDARGAHGEERPAAGCDDQNDQPTVALGALRARRARLCNRH